MSKYTIEQVEACILAYRNGDLNYCRAGIIDLLTAYAATLKAAQGGVTEAMVDGPALLQIARNVGLREVMFNVSAERATPLLQAFFAAALEAALSAEPAEQGEVFPTACMPPEQEEMKAASLAIGSWLAAALDDPSVCDEMKRDINRWFDAAMPSAPPAQPAERVPEGLLRKALTIAANIRTADWLEAGGTVREQDALADYLASPAPSEGGKGVDRD